jgi:hypothetical protein
MRAWQTDTAGMRHRCDAAAGPVTHARPLDLLNLERAKHLIPDRLVTADGVIAFDPLAACRLLLAQRVMFGTLVEQHERNGDVRVVSVGAAVVVQPGFVTHERERPRPGIGERVLVSALTPPSVALTQSQAEAHNVGDGISLVVVLHHWSPAEPVAVQGVIRRDLMTSFMNDVRGFHLREILLDIEEAEAQWGTAGGFRVRSTYREWYERHAEPLPRRVQFGVTRDEALAQEGSVISMLFHDRPPRFDFTAAQRRMLQQALQHKTDEEITQSLGLSMSAVKKTWAAVFERAPMLLADLPAPAAGNGTTRGAQKRHRLLTYLRDHPEELKP